MFEEGTIADGPNGPIIFQGGRWVPMGAQRDPMTVAPDPLRVQEFQQQQQDRAAANARAADSAAQSAQSQQYNNTLKLRGEFDALPVVKNYRVGIEQLAQAINTAPDATGDNALIYAYAKAMDPGSVVRESEMGMAASGASVFDAAVANLKKQFNVEGGGQLSPAVRDRLRREVINKVTQMAASYDAQRKRFSDDAKAFGIDPIRVVGEHDAKPFVNAFKDYDRRQRGEAADGKQVATLSSGPTPGLASPGASTKSIPVPAAMQQEYEGYVRSRLGRLDPNEYAAFRASLDEKYGFPGSQGAVYQEEAKTLNTAAQNPNDYSISLKIPPANARMTGLDQLNATLFNNPFGAGVLGAGSLAGGVDEVVGFGKSLALGTDYATERDKIDAMRQASADAYPGSTLAGNVAGGIGTGFALGPLAPAMNTLRGAMGTGGLYGTVNGALENNDNRFSGALMGGIFGAGGGAIGQKVIAPGLSAFERRATPMLGNAFDTLRGRTGDRQALALPSEQAAIANTAGDLQAVRDRLQEAGRMNMPFSLADANPKLRALAGAVTRKSVNARELAENTYLPRGRGQADRAMEAIDSYLAPITDVAARGKQLIQAGNEAATPYYTMARSQAAPVDDQVGAFLNTPAGQDAMRRAREIAGNEGRDPNAMGFDLNDQGDVAIRNMPSFETLDLVKRGFDARLNEARDPITRQLDLEGNPQLQAIENLRRNFVSRLDQLNPNYPKARAEYSKFAQRRDALDTGLASTGQTMLPRNLKSVLDRLEQQLKPEFQRGYATGMADQVGKVRLSGNPYEAVYGSPQQQQKVAQVFPQGAREFDRVYNLEGDMARTQYETLGGSPTAGRLQADNQLGSAMMEQGVNAFGQAATGGWGMGTAMRLASDAIKLGIGKQGERKADRIAPVLMDTSDPAAMASYLDDIIAKSNAIRAVTDKYKRRAGLFGATILPAAALPITVP